MFPGIDLRYAKARRFLLPAWGICDLVLAGCGGTGSWLAPALVRIATVLTKSPTINVTFVDPDIVEEKNVYRQNFCRAEIGMPKAQALALRYSAAWGKEIAYRVMRIGEALESVRSGIIIGCVDKPAARREIANFVNQRNWLSIYWLDCGNEKDNGQVLFGGGKRNDNEKEIPGLCSHLPIPSELAPDIITDRKGSDPEVSCADMMLLESQGMAINQRMAAEAADYLVRLLVTHDLRKYATYIDLASGTARSEYIPEGESSEKKGKKK
jgi:PRTRC genetic system ThiF family protein